MPIDLVGYDISYASNLSIFICILLKVKLVYYHYYISNLYIFIPWTQADLNFFFFNILFRKSYYVLFFVFL